MVLVCVVRHPGKQNQQEHSEDDDTDYLVNSVEFTDPLGNEWCFGCGTWRNFGNPATRPRKPAPEPKKDDSFWYKDKITDEDIWGQNMH